MNELLSLLAIAMTAVTAPPADWNSTIASSSPLNWYRLDEISGLTAFDYGSEGRDGAYGTGVHAPVRGATGLVGGAVEFDGNQDNTLFNAPALTGDWTAEFLIKKTGTKFSAELLRGAPLEFPSTHLKLEQYPNTGEVGYTESFVVDRVFSPPVVASVGEFIALAYVKKASGMEAYINGVLKGTNSSTISLSRYQFGDTASESPFAIVDEIVVYDRALSVDELALHFHSIPEPTSLAVAVGFAVVFCLASARSGSLKTWQGDQECSQFILVA